MVAETQTLSGEYVVDNLGRVWMVVRDGGMVTRADYGGVTSAGLVWLQHEHGPLRSLNMQVEQWQAAIADVVRLRAAIADAPCPEWCGDVTQGELDADGHNCWKSRALAGESS